jgi:hypothetical protein
MISPINICDPFEGKNTNYNLLFIIIIINNFFFFFFLMIKMVGEPGEGDHVINLLEQDRPIGIK